MFPLCIRCNSSINSYLILQNVSKLFYYLKTSNTSNKRSALGVFKGLQGAFPPQRNF